MSTLGLEGLGQTVRVDGGTTERIGGQPSDRAVAREMAKQGMDMPKGFSSEGTPDGSQSATKATMTSFSDALRSSVEKANEMQVQADSAIKELAAGRTKNIHETMLAVERADTSLKLMMQVRNKVLDAYREIMRMQV